MKELKNPALPTPCVKPLVGIHRQKLTRHTKLTQFEKVLCGLLKLGLRTEYHFDFDFGGAGSTEGAMFAQGAGF